MRRCLGAAGLLFLAACGSPTGGPPAVATAVASASSAQSPTAGSAAACSGKATPAQTEGPYFKAGSPEKKTLREAGMAGTHLVLSGHVFTAACAPVAGAVLDFWHADASGTYDNSGYRLRGHQSTDQAGAYSLDTIIPGLYPGRTEHIHVKVEVAGKPTLTTQLYFPGVSRNSEDSIFDPAMLVALSDRADGKQATFDFVI